MKYWHLDGVQASGHFFTMKKKRRAPKVDLIKRMDLGFLEFLMPQETDLIVPRFLVAIVVTVTSRCCANKKSG